MTTDSNGWLHWRAYEVDLIAYGDEWAVIVPALNVDAAIKIVRFKFGETCRIVSVRVSDRRVFHWGMPPNQLSEAE